MASDTGDDDLTAMERYWRDEGVTDQQREGLVEEGLDDPAQQEGVEVDNTVATETTDSGEVVNTVTVDSAEEDPDIVTTDSGESGVTESGDVVLVEPDASGSNQSGQSDQSRSSDQSTGGQRPQVTLGDVIPDSNGGGSLAGFEIPTTNMVIGLGVLALGFVALRGE